jgi:hypothetical protein
VAFTSVGERVRTWLGDSATSLLTVVMLATVAGCGSSVGGSAIRTGPVQLPAYEGPVAIYPSGQPPSGAVDLGVVEVHAYQQEATVDVLLPQFVRKVAQIGGNVAVIDAVRARFEVYTRPHIETFYYTCGFGMTCAGTRMYSANEEIMLVSMTGRAFSTRAADSGSVPLIPAAPPPVEAPKESDEDAP